MKKENNINLDFLKEKFSKNFGKEGRTFFAPSRINLIGEHIDYNEGKVLPCAIDIGTYAICKENDCNTLNLESLNIDEPIKINLDNLDYNEDYSWANYVSGMVKCIRNAGYNVSGLDILIKGNIPYGAGLSSSASLEMLIGKIVNVLFNDDKIPKVEMAKLGQMVENQHFGLNSGIMDQFAINLGRKNSLIHLNTNTLEYEYIDFDPKGKKIAILNTNKNRNLNESKYNERFNECKKALEIMKNHVDIDNLCQIDDVKILDYIEDETIKKRAIHVVEENLRVGEMVKAIEEEDYLKIGEILNKSHTSLKENYEVTGFYLDSIVEGANLSKYTIGSRMIGAGFAGCAIAIVEEEGLEDFENKVKNYYKEKTGLDADIIYSGISDGPREVI